MAAKDPCLRALTFFRALVASGGPLEVPCAAEPALHTQPMNATMVLPACWMEQWVACSAEPTMSPRLHRLRRLTGTLVAESEQLDGEAPYRLTTHVAAQTQVLIAAL